MLKENQQNQQKFSPEYTENEVFFFKRRNFYVYERSVDVRTITSNGSTETKLYILHNKTEMGYP